MQTLSMIRLDLLLETIGGTVALLISHFANGAFKLTGEKRLSDLSTGFLVLSAAMFGRVIGTIYFFVLRGGGTEGSETAQTLMAVVTIAYGVMKIMAYVLFAFSTRPAASSTRPQPTVLLALPALLDSRLEIVAVIILIVVVLQSILNYLAVRTKYALYVLVGFSLLLLGHLTLILSNNPARGYMMHQVFQFGGLLSLLVMLVRVGQVD